MLTLVLFSALLSFVQCSIKSFGIITGRGLSLASVRLRLNWGSDIYECYVTPHQTWSQYNCSTDNPSTSLVSSNNKQQYSIQVRNQHVDAFWIDTIFVIDDNDNIYTIDDFCASQHLVYPLNGIHPQVSASNQCQIFNDQSGTESLSQIAIDSDDYMLTLINIYFRDDILHYPNSINPGYVTSSKLQKFGFMTSSDAAASVTTDILVTLFWNRQIAQCVMTPILSNTMYWCYVNEATLCFNEAKYQNQYRLLVQNNNADTLEIQSAVVYDAAGYHYGISSFCVNNAIPQSGRNDIVTNTCSPTDFQYFEDVCSDNSNCNAPYLDIEFGTDFFANPNSYDSDGMVMPGAASSVLTCAPTQAPSYEPSKYPTVNPSTNPTTPPTVTPTVIPTDFPSTDPTLSPTNPPSNDPTTNPSESPTNVPTLKPSKTPTHRPTINPSKHPSEFPTNNPTFLPTNAPTITPTAPPTDDPTYVPTSAPTVPPTGKPTKMPTFPRAHSEHYIYVYIGPISWIEANEYCVNTFGSSLAFIGASADNGEASYLVQLQSVTDNSTQSAFFGYNQYYDKDQWKFVGELGWSDLGYTNWDADNGQPGTQGCATIGQEGLWYTTSCTSRQDRSILCNTYSDVIADGPFGTKYVFVGEISWTEANKYCETHYETTLVTINSDEENNDLVLFATHQFNSYAIIQQFNVWIGLTDIANNTKWIDGSEVTYVNWFPNHQPSTWESCGSLVFHDGYWRDEQCYSKGPHPFFCNAPTNVTKIPPTESPTSSPTATPTVIVESSLNDNFILVWRQFISWVEADDYCETEYGTQLASVTSMDQNMEIANSATFYYNRGEIPTTCTFFGLHRLMPGGWTDMHQSISNYSNWGSDPYFAHKCAFFCSSAQWYSTDCTEKYNRIFACESPFENTVITETTTYTSTKVQIEERNEDYIYTYSSEPNTWFEANEVCVNEYGTTLVNIDSPNLNMEATYSINIANSKYSINSNCSFIGLNDLHQFSDWKWIDGATMKYSNLANNEMNNVENKHCSVLCEDSIWYPVSCQFKCEYCSILCNTAAKSILVHSTVHYITSTEDFSEQGRQETTPPPPKSNWLVISASLLFIILIILLGCCLLVQKNRKLKQQLEDNYDSVNVEETAPVTEDTKKKANGDFHADDESSSDELYETDQLQTQTPNHRSKHQRVDSESINNEDRISKITLFDAQDQDESNKSVALQIIQSAQKKDSLQ